MIESPFIVKNAQSSIKIGIAAALYKKIIFYEYPTRKIKMSMEAMLKKSR